ncbi:MAG TPA: hypothetical protein VJ725_13125, partial [Thermoanaerobaculia bacterium]|nr:hypothetical protein [Thermoanaerobaculia bacterium]
MRPATNPKPSPEAVAEGRKRRIHFILGIAVALLGSGLGLTLDGLAVVTVLSTAISIGFMIVRGGEGPLKGMVEPRLRELRIRAATLESVWRQEANANVFHDALRDLKKNAPSTWGSRRCASASLPSFTRISETRSSTVFWIVTGSRTRTSKGSEKA